jgi:hypothetical protein
VCGNVRAQGGKPRKPRMMPIIVGVHLYRAGYIDKNVIPGVGALASESGGIIASA